MTSSIKSEFEKVKLVYQNKVKAQDRPQTLDRGRLYQALLEDWDEGEIDLIQEVKLLLLDREGRVMSIYSLSKGGMDMDQPPLDPKVIFAAALTRRAHEFMLVQNYPGGEFKPSYLDYQQIAQIAKGGEILDLPLTDYMVITPEGYYSLKEHENNDLNNSNQPILG